jgi:3D (Asp-Asp-Asp) domain-containing protein
MQQMKITSRILCRLFVGVGTICLLTVGEALSAWTHGFTLNEGFFVPEASWFRLRPQASSLKRQEARVQPQEARGKRLESGGKSEQPTGVYMWVTVTAYCPCSICTDGDGITSTNTTAWVPGVAIDPLIIRQGVHLDIPGYGEWIKADDTGKAIVGGHIDVRFFNHREAKRWGTRRLKIRVWSE